MNKAIIHDIAIKRIAAKEKLDAINKQVKTIKTTLNELDDALLRELTESQLTLTRIEGHTISINTQELYTPTDWATFNKFTEENNCSYLYQRRLTQKAVDEIVELMGKDNVPVTVFTKRSISVRKVK